MKKNSRFLKLSLPLILFSGASLKTLAFDTWWHAECTRKAMVTNGFSADARLATQVSNYLTDFFPAYNVANEKLSHLNEKLAGAGIQRLELNGDLSFEFMHFDAVYTEADIEQNWKLLLENTIRALRKYAASADVKPGFQPTYDTGFLLPFQLGKLLQFHEYKPDPDLV
jgi:hypothetical protein